MNGKVNKGSYTPTCGADWAGGVIIFSDRGLLALSLLKLKVNMGVNHTWKDQLSARVNHLRGQQRLGSEDHNPPLANAHIRRSLPPCINNNSPIQRHIQVNHGILHSHLTK